MTWRKPDFGKPERRARRTPVFPLLFFAGLALLAGAWSSAAAEEGTTKKPGDWIREAATLHEGEKGEAVQKLAIIGRYHGQIYSLDSNQGDAVDWEHRRSRLGMQVDFLDHFRFDFTVNFDYEPGAERFVRDLEDAQLTWKPIAALTLVAGKMKAPITYEWRTSSNAIATVERSRIVTTVVTDKMGGIKADVEFGRGFGAEAGLYTNSVDPDWAYPTFDGGASLFAGLRWKTAGAGTLRFEYFHQRIREGSNRVSPYEHVFSLNYHGDFGRFGLALDGIYARGDAGRPDAFGVVVIPTFDLAESLQLVARYSYAGSDGGAGLKIPPRYDGFADGLLSRSGDKHHAAYLGLNWFVGGENLKVMGGVEYSHFDQAEDEFQSITLLGAVRVFF